MDTANSDVFLYFLSILIPPAGVLVPCLQKQVDIMADDQGFSSGVGRRLDAAHGLSKLMSGCAADFWINILLTILGWLPGVIHAWYISACMLRPITGSKS
jgi:uncharacterized membrane protein YqaE (UPF0057 family)